ncbi:ArsR/SmtB family transcription factor [Haloplasma contractile]|uniref:Transcriptional regulator protein n=1 Tax=Haloplasma contractile SSD-17B TaxID=1033810 RepID=F7PWB4_9MOLU|nr:metalloregulator ArsR/SmtB family transcription factor [Haloplasma contractile]ERJ11229.1 Transcriptional regulator protein [Haloplasma contractile SSD-17B]
MELFEVFKLVADETRLRIINLLMMGELCVCEIEAILDLSQSKISRHLNALRKESVIDYERRTSWNHYFIEQSFLDEHSDLIIYLEEDVLNKEPFNLDRDRLEHYQTSCYTCASITDYKQNK